MSGYQSGSQTKKGPKPSCSTKQSCHAKSPESAGVGDGLSMRKDMGDTTMLSNVSYNESIDKMTGNPTGRPKPYKSTSVSEKGGNFEIC